MRALPTAVFVLSLTTITAAQSPPDSLTSQLAAARQLVDQGKPREAVGALSALDRSDPRVAELLGVAYYHADDYAQAIEVLAPVVSKLPGDSIEQREAEQVLGLSYYLAGRLPEALPLLERTSRWATDNLQLAQVLGMAYIQTRQPDRAREALARAFGVDPASAGAHLLAAQMMIRVEFFEMADAELGRALAMDPRLPRVNFLLGENAIYRNRIEDGVAYLEKELALNPGDAMSLYRIGEAWSRRAAWDKAIPPLQRSIWINPFFSGPYIVLGRAYLATAKPDAAEGMLQHAVELDPNNKAAHYLLGQVLQRLGKAEQAKEQFEIASKLSEK
jgi:tetratricopeptide (TPR) repeat protein